MPKKSRHSGVKWWALTLLDRSLLGQASMIETTGLKSRISDISNRSELLRGYL